MDDRGVQQRERVRAAPPARGIGRIAAVAGPGVGLVVFQHVVFADVLREAVGFEYAHVFARGEDVSALQCMVDADDKAGDELALIQLAGGQLGVQRGDEVAPDHGLIRDARMPARRDLGEVYDVEMTLDLLFAGLLGGLCVVEHVECVVIRVFRIDTVACKTAAQTIGAVVHGADRLDDACAVLACAVLVEDTGDRAAGGDADFAFFLQHGASSLYVRAAGRPRQGAGWGHASFREAKPCANLTK